MDKAFLEQMKKKVDTELRTKEAEVIAFWKEEIEKILHKKTDSLSSMQVELRGLLTRMENRLKMVKRPSDF